MIPLNNAQRTIAHARILHSLGQKKRRGRIPKQIYPKGIEREYANALKGLLAHARVALTPLMHALPGLLERAQRSRQDADETRSLKDLLEAARRALAQAVNPNAVEGLARQFGRRAQEFNRVQLGRQVRAALGADVFGSDRRVAAYLEHFVSENASLIKSIPNQVIDQVEHLVNRAVTSAQTSSELADDIADRFSVGESRAELIARDQIGKVYGQTNAYRQQDLGITRFVWRTSGDERVRPEHDALDGESFPYDDPPAEGLPGEPIQCRCTAEPDFDSLRDALDNGDDTQT